MRSTPRFCAVPTAALALTLAAIGCSTHRVSYDARPEVGASGAQRYEGFGDYRRPITTRSIEAQRWFNQGMQLLYGFNHDEAIRSFQEAAAHDPEAAMPWWGIAYANGININDPQMTEQRSRDAAFAARQARLRLDGESAVERALVMAVSERYAWPAPADRRPLDEAYADAMQRAYRQLPDDPDVGALYAESLMNLQPWDYWTTEGEPKGRIEEIVAVLEDVMERRPDHPGASHFYIHAVEASQDPDRAVAASERLLGLVPGSGHLVHMPSHIFIRVGRYADAADSNVAAIEADRTYFKRAPEPALYAMYYGHNFHMLTYAGMMAGQYERAIRAARDLEAEMPKGPLKAYAGLIEGMMPANFHVLIRFGKWEEILDEPDYPEWRLVSRAIRRYARSIALSALGRTSEARAEMAAFEDAAERIPGDWWIYNNKVSEVLPIARCMVEGELLFREGRCDEAFERLREGVRREDALVYDEPPAWMLPVRHALGALLMSADRYEEAERVYRDDLRENRENGWALLGLAQALEAQGKDAEAASVRLHRERVWADADVEPTSSCYCEPGGPKPAKSR